MFKRFTAPIFVLALSLCAIAFTPIAHAKSNQKTAKTSSVKSKAIKKKKLRLKAKAPRKPSFGRMAGLHQSSDELSLRSSVAYVIDQDTQEVLFSKNDNAVLPIASITKLMTGVVIRESHLSMDEPITITQEDIDTEKGSTSRLRPGTTLTRGELLHLALMSSENRAAHALGRTYPSGLTTFVSQMN